MEFKELKQLQQNHITALLENASALFVAEINKDELWELYLDSFPSGTNEVFRERREYDCSCCRHFIKQFGNIVAIVDYGLVSIWDFETGDGKFQPVLNALSEMIKSAAICDVFVTKESAFGTDKSHEQLESGAVHTWHHFRAELPKRFVSTSHKTVSSVMAEYRDIKAVFKRSLEEITKDAIETILDLIAEKTLYKGEEWCGSLEKFLALHNEYHSLETDKQNAFCWLKSVEVGGAIGKIRNHSMGVLLVDISNGAELNEAVRKYEAIVAPTNYKRPKVIFSKKMVEQAQETVKRLGFLESLGRRHATLSDITINNVLWANRDVVPYMNGNGNGVFELLKQEATESPKKFDNVPGVGIDDFVNNILPNAGSVEVLLENKHEPNLMTLIAPQVLESKTMFKWGNGFSWAYNGNITDSMKERIRAMGGKVEGVLRASLQWENNNDFDLHCIEPNGNHIFFQTKGRAHPSSGMLDVDIIEPFSDRRVVDGTAVENIIYSNKERMLNGEYKIYIHNYTHRGGTTGFQAEIEYNGQIYSYEYTRELSHNENVLVARFRFDKQKGIEFIESLPSTTASKTIWGIATNQFHPVTAFMFSPNYWDEQTGIGHKHYFFVVSNCKTDDRPNGFFNEFLQEDLMEHKRVFEALGSKMRVEISDEQLSGLGFSSTKRNSLVCRVNNQKVIKIVF